MATRVRNTFQKRQKELARKENRQWRSVQIEYEGSVVAQTSRDYYFLVIDALPESRQFTVKVPLDLFRSTSLLYQDGPSLCFEILQKELDSETQESLVKSHLYRRKGYTGIHGTALSAQTFVSRNLPATLQLSDFPRGWLVSSRLVKNHVGWPRRSRSDVTFPHQANE